MTPSTGLSRDPWQAFEQVLADPSRLQGATAKELGSGFQAMYSAIEDDERSVMRLLSRCAVSVDQATRWLFRAQRKKAGNDLPDSVLLKNPYLLFERDRHQVDPIALSIVDRALFPQGTIAADYPVPAPSAPSDAADARRAKAFVIDVLSAAAFEEGHTLLPVEWVEERVTVAEASPTCPLTPLLSRVLKGTLGPDVVPRQTLGGDAAWQLLEFTKTRDLIRSCIQGKRANGNRQIGSHDWRAQIDRELGAADPLDIDETLGRIEKAACLEELYRAPISVLVGAAGTGKTTLLKALTSLSDVVNGNVLLLAPTGKARVRLEQATGGRHQAWTIAQYLLKHGERFEPRRMRYLVGKPGAKPITNHKTIIVDECSMLTEEQLASVLDAFDLYDRLVLVGDPRQLPPIGAGRPFADIVRELATSVPVAASPRVAPCYAELTVTRRHRSGPTAGARDDLRLASIFSGETTDPASDEVWTSFPNETSETIHLVRWDSVEELEQLLERELISELQLSSEADVEAAFAKTLGATLNPTGAYFRVGRDGGESAVEHVSDWQVLSPVRGLRHGVDSINRVIKNRFRQRVRAWLKPPRKIPKAAGSEAILYGDKVISVKNGERYEAWTDPARKTYIANGDVGLLVGDMRSEKRNRAPSEIHVEYEAHQGKRIEYGGGSFADDAPLELAYALTVHRVQGSEFGTTFVVLPKPCRLLSRELLYTALTRQEHRVVLLHQGPFHELSIYAHPSNSELAKRLTNLFVDPAPVNVTAITPTALVGPGKPQPRWLDNNYIHLTTKGDLVQSKSELLIAEKLYEWEQRGVLRYEYERRVVLDGREIKPDFTVWLRANNRLFYWEHLGMLGSSRYAAKWELKRQRYERCGIVDPVGGSVAPSLVTTRDDLNGGLSAPSINEVIETLIVGT